MLTGGLARTARLLSLPLGAVALAAEGTIRRSLGQDASQVRTQLRQRNAERTRRVLGELKGGALKAGQLLSTVEMLFPQDPEQTWREALVSLQESNRGVPFAQVRQVLHAELGPGWASSFRRLSESPVAAASLGQVHRGVWHDGRPVAVKVQYPGVREAVTADLRTLSLLTRASALVAPGMALPPLVSELRTRLVEELDYLHEAASQRAFRAAFDDEVVIPDVVHASGRVLVMDWVGGTPLAEVARSGTQQERDAAGAAYQLFLVSGPERAGLLHTDPHPGNFRVLDDGRLGVLDFGSTLALDGMPDTFGRLISALLVGNGSLVLQRLREDGFVRAGASLEVDKLMDYMAPFTEPARHERFAFTRDWMRQEFGRVNDPRDPDFAVAMKLTLPAEHLFTHRVWLGLVGVLCQLEATVAVRPVLQRWLPGFP